MNKETYIDALERKLWDRLDPDQLRDIISYYKDYFAMEAAKGISEEETIRKLGDPALLAKSILAAKGESAESEIEQGIQKQGREFRGGKLLVLLVIVAVLIVLCAIIGLIFSVVSALLPFLFVLAFVFLIFSFFKNKR